jgi:P27 family predicted phage terminase small subunit
VVGSLPADFFTARDMPLLRAFVCASANLESAAAEIARDGAVIDGPRGRRVTHPAVFVMSTSAAVLCAVGMKLRLTPSSRMRCDTAATKANAAPTSKKPWA